MERANGVEEVAIRCCHARPIDHEQIQVPQSDRVPSERTKDVRAHSCQMESPYALIAERISHNSGTGSGAFQTFQINHKDRGRNNSCQAPWTDHSDHTVG
jgi:hypothetical protein